MKRLALIAALGASCLAIAGCSRDDHNETDANNAAAAAGENGAEAAGAAAIGRDGLPEGRPDRRGEAARPTGSTPTARGSR